MPKTAHNHFASVPPFHQAWHAQEPQNPVVSSLLGERVAALRVSTPCSTTVVTERAVPLPSERDDRAELSRPDHTAGPATAIESLGLTLFTADGHMRPLVKIEADLIRLAVQHYSGRMTEVARRLNISRSTLYRKLDAYQIAYTPE